MSLLAGLCALFIIILVILLLQAPGVFLLMLLGIGWVIYAVWRRLQKWWQEFNAPIGDDNHDGR